MIRLNPNSDMPQIHPGAYVDNTAIVCGKVIIEDNVYVGPYAVIRADETNEKGDMDPIIIRANSNIQDGVVIHSKDGGLVDIGECTSIAHRSIIHGPCKIGDRVFIGFNSVIFNCEIGEGCAVRHNAVIDGCDLPAGFYVPSTMQLSKGSCLDDVPRVQASESEFSEQVITANHELVKGYKALSNEF